MKLPTAVVHHLKCTILDRPKSTRSLCKLQATMIEANNFLFSLYKQLHINQWPHLVTAVECLAYRCFRYWDWTLFCPYPFGCLLHPSDCFNFKYYFIAFFTIIFVCHLLVRVKIMHISSGTIKAITSKH